MNKFNTLFESLMESIKVTTKVPKGTKKSDISGHEDPNTAAVYTMVFKKDPKKKKSLKQKKQKMSVKGLSKSGTTKAGNHIEDDLEQMLNLK